MDQAVNDLLKAGSSLLTGNVLGTAIDVGEFISAHNKEEQAKKELAQLKTPFYKVQDQYFQNQKLAAAQAGQGATSTERQYFTDQSNKALSTGLSTILQISNDPNRVSQLLDSFAKSVGSFAAKSSEQQAANIDQYMKANKDVAGQLTTQWGLNEFQPYQDKLKELTERRGAAEQNQFGALQAIAGIQGANQVAQSNQDLITKLFAKDNTGDDLPIARKKDIDFTLQPQ